MPGKAVLSKERKREITDAFVSWYSQQDHKREALLRIGTDFQRAHFYRNGKLIPQPHMLFMLYQETGNTCFLFTKHEKTRVLRGNWHVSELPPPEEWPDQDDIALQPDIEKKMEMLRRLIREVTKQIADFGKMSENDPKRNQARSRLVGPAMELFQALQLLKLPYPSAFADLLEQMSLASRLTNPNAR